MKTIFVVDDIDTNLLTTEKILSEHYNVYTLPSAAGMFELLEAVRPDLILLDIEMPEMDGFEALQRLKATERHADIPVIFLTSRNNEVAEVHGFELGAVDFITKPFSPPILLNHIKSHLNIDGLIRERTAMLQQRTEKLQLLQSSLVSVLADMVEMRDSTTGRHIDRTAKYIRILLSAMLEREVYSGEISEWDLEMVVSSSRLHDVGKIAITDALLNKRERLTAEEFEKMKTHAAEGEKIIEKIITQSGEESFLLNAKLFAGCHHERWDGTGYPKGTGGAAIPLQGRVMAIVDVYDALVSERPYKAAFSEEEAVNIIMDGKGSQFDPKIAETFFEVRDMFAEVSRSLRG
ncbi:MAG: response regulator [Planctomycetes bacterium]|nr:response regulator [Planctomycetota bacterium]